jgi:hypothetical protein
LAIKQPAETSLFSNCNKGLDIVFERIFLPIVR